MTTISKTLQRQPKNELEQRRIQLNQESNNTQSRQTVFGYYPSILDSNCNATIQSTTSSIYHPRIYCYIIGRCLEWWFNFNNIFPCMPDDAKEPPYLQRKATRWEEGEEE